MNLVDLTQRTPVPIPWAEGDNIPWHDPTFSAAMLREHLSQTHDAASRRSAIIERHVAWIHDHLLQGRPTRILDLGCGPGFYSQRLAQRGHTCVGIDYAPASIAYAAGEASAAGLPCAYTCADIRAADYGGGFGLAMLIYGEMNVFRPGDLRAILKKVWRALDVDGLLLLEPHTFAAVRRMDATPRTWYSSPAGLFASAPHLVLEEHVWDPAQRATTVRYYVITAADGRVTPYAQTFQAYTDDELRGLLMECGFDDLQVYPALGGVAAGAESLYALTARKQ